MWPIVQVAPNMPLATAANLDDSPQLATSITKKMRFLRHSSSKAGQSSWPFLRSLCLFDLFARLRWPRMVSAEIPDHTSRQSSSETVRFDYFC